MPAKSDAIMNFESKNVLFEEWKNRAVEVAFGPSVESVPVRFADIVAEMLEILHSPAVSAARFKRAGESYLVKLAKRRADALF